MFFCFHIALLDDALTLPYLWFMFMDDVGVYRHFNGLHWNIGVLVFLRLL